MLHVQKVIKYFSHTGDIGDLIAGLTLIKALGGGHLVLFPSGPQGRMTPDRVAVLKPLLEYQSYIKSVEWKQHVVGENLDKWRRCFGQGKNLAEMHTNCYDMPEHPLEEPWIKVPEPKYVAQVIMHRSIRYTTSHFPWRTIVEKYGKNAVFVGFKYEHDIFCPIAGHIPFYPIQDYMELAQIIAGCKLFIGNRSSPWWVSEALKKNSILETSAGHDCFFPRMGVIYGTMHSFMLPDID